MDPAVREYVDALSAELRPLFDRVHALVVAECPAATVSMSYAMPTYTSSGRRLHVGVWRHGVSLYGWKRGHDDGFSERNPELVHGRATIRLTPSVLAAISDRELRGFIRAVLDP